MKANLFLCLTACIGINAAVVSLPTDYQKRDVPTVDLGYEVHLGSLNSTGNYYTFSNVPYAEQPVDKLRFQKPVPITRNGSDINAGLGEVMCVQAFPQWLIELQAKQSGIDPAAMALLMEKQVGQTEACLMLDVYVPVGIFKNRTTAEAPVVVWVHGGGYTSGSKTAAGNPAGLIARSQDHDESGVIVVSINYRLGLFGWLAGDDITPNLGLHDQRAAFEWVQRHISRFGGCADKVTVMGESAGASSIVHHITAYGGAVPAPFQAAIPQSPAFQFNIDLAAAYLATLTEASKQVGTAVDGVAELKKLSADKLKSINQATVSPAQVGSFTFGVGPDGSYVPKIPQLLLREGRFAHNVNLLISHTSNESIIFVPSNISTAADVAAYTRTSIPSASNATLHELLTSVYPDVLDGTYPWTTQFARAVQLTTELQFSCITRYLGTAFGNATHNYVFAVPPGIHGADVPYTFYNGDGASASSDVGDPALAEALQAYIVGFVRTGDPNDGGSGGLVPFPVYGSGAEVLELREGGAVKGVDDLKNGRCDWILQALADGSL
ncbi:Alpha/Beta hydrolase protein [Whalleya microplaca]|nr:Alpha/Beta hydrolase protein [Whalleya microplaca]